MVADVLSLVRLDDFAVRRARELFCHSCSVREPSHMTQETRFPSVDVLSGFSRSRGHNRECSEHANRVRTIRVRCSELTRCVPIAEGSMHKSIEQMAGTADCDVAIELSSPSKERNRSLRSSADPRLARGSRRPGDRGGRDICGARLNAWFANLKRMRKPILA